MNSIIYKIEILADRFGKYLDRFVFVGGATTSLLITDPAVSYIRPTKDIDVIVDVSSNAKYAELEIDLRKMGFTNVIEQNAPICRWQIEDILVDIMPTQTRILGFSNRWYQKAVDECGTAKLPSGTIIQIVKPEYFIATKIDAFLGRGKNDFIMSHDVEDIITVIDGRPELIKEVWESATEVQKFIQTYLNSFKESGDFCDAVLGFYPTDTIGQSRYAVFMERLEGICRQ